MKLLFISEEQKARVISKVETTAPELAKDLYLNTLRGGEISNDALRETEPPIVDGDIPQIESN